MPSKCDFIIESESEHPGVGVRPQASGRPRHSTCDYAPQPGFKCCVPMNYTYGSSTCPLSGNPKSWVEESQDFLYFFKPKFCSKICFYSQQKCANYLRKTNARDDLCSKNQCLAHVFVLAKKLILVLLLLVGG